MTICHGLKSLGVWFTAIRHRVVSGFTSTHVGVFMVVLGLSAAVVSPALFSRALSVSEAIALALSNALTRLKRRIYLLVFVDNLDTFYYLLITMATTLRNKRRLSAFFLDTTHYASSKIRNIRRRGSAAPHKS